MKPGRIAILLITFLMVLTQADHIYSQTAKVYVSVPEENLRIAPNGRKIGTVLENTEMVAVAENGNWVQVQITGWIWKPSLSTVRKSIVGAYRASHIMVKTRAEAEAVLEELKAGKDFAEVAKAKSIAPSAPIGGDLGFFNKGDFNPVFENAILSLEPGEVSGIVEANDTYNIFKRVK